jgi:hypothetical protein
MISTQRLLLMFLMINVIVGIVDVSYYNPLSYDNQFLDGITTDLDEFSENIQKEDSIWGGILGKLIDAVSTIVNGVRLGFLLLYFFFKIMIPWPIARLTSYSAIELMIVDFINLFRLLMTLLAGLEIYNLFKNKKAT